MSALIVIAAGGTGGHFFPAEALAAELQARGHRIALMTDARSGGLASPAFADAHHHVLPGAGIAGRGPWRAAKAIAALAAGTLQARAILSRTRPAAVIGFGGYPSVGPVLGASLLRHRPAILLHEQNAVLGRANRFLARRADTLALSFAATSKISPGTATKVTGNPVRPALAALAATQYAPPADTIRLLVLGGSLGARVFSDIVPAAISLLPTALRARLAITQQCRAEDLDRVRTAYTGLQAELSPFFQDVAGKLAEAHLVIARAGASTVAELAVAGRPAILVPLPGAIDDHQTANARALAAAGGAWVIPQPGFTAETLAAKLTELASAPAALSAASAAARTQARSDAAARLADLVEAAIAARTGKALDAPPAPSGADAAKQDPNTEATENHGEPRRHETRRQARSAQHTATPPSAERPYQKNSKTRQIRVARAAANFLSSRRRQSMPVASAAQTKYLRATPWPSVVSVLKSCFAAPPSDRAQAALDARNPLQAPAPLPNPEGAPA
jgi:UDP-N-acetylglucosamine--N-acetylmuramyl-(pentapeptide) pyrophosphoryl-undecaprenol N-acetylglucosamine transferase